MRRAVRAWQERRWAAGENLTRVLVAGTGAVRAEVRTAAGPGAAAGDLRGDVTATRSFLRYAAFIALFPRKVRNTQPRPTDANICGRTMKKLKTPM